MLCPRCFQEVQIIGGKVYCPTCKIYLSENVTSFQKQYPVEQLITQRDQMIKKVEDNTKQGKIRDRKRIIKILLISFTIISIAVLVPTGLLYTYFYSGPNGYREEILSKYGFTEEAKWYYRLHTMFFVNNKGVTYNLFIANGTYPGGEAGMYDPLKKHVILNHPNDDELAIHELGHAWWDKMTKEDPTVKQRFLADTISLSKSTNAAYGDFPLVAFQFLYITCKCGNINNLNYKSVDVDHIYVYWTVYTMGKFKDGERALPQFMRHYFDKEFNGKVNIPTCYEQNKCTHMRFDPSNNKNIKELRDRFYLNT